MFSAILNSLSCVLRGIYSRKSMISSVTVSRLLKFTFSMNYSWRSLKLISPKISVKNQFSIILKNPSGINTPKTSNSSRSPSLLNKIKVSILDSLSIFAQFSCTRWYFLYHFCWSPKYWIFLRSEGNCWSILRVFQSYVH